MDDELMDMMVADGSAAQVSDKMKDILFAKSAQRIDSLRPHAAASLFGQNTGEEISGDEE